MYVDLSLELQGSLPSAVLKRLFFSRSALFSITTRTLGYLRRQPDRFCRTRWPGHPPRRRHCRNLPPRPAGASPPAACGPAGSGRPREMRSARGGRQPSRRTCGRSCRAARRAGGAASRGGRGAGAQPTVRLRDPSARPWRPASRPGAASLRPRGPGPHRRPRPPPLRGPAALAACPLARS